MSDALTVQGVSPKKRRSAASKKSGELWWQLKDVPVPLSSEEKVLEVLLKRGRKERAMICKQPPNRLRQIEKALKNVPGLTLHQALSLRRHHISKLHPGRRPTQLGLGDEKSIRESADVFERVVEDCLKMQGVDFWNENQQKNNTDNEIRLTPDFRFPSPVRLHLFRTTKNNQRHAEKVVEIHWLEAKMFYGASSIPHGAPGAVGTVLEKMERYVQAFGPGAVVFMHGFGDQLAEDLQDVGVTVLSGLSIPPSMMQRVWDHQRTWCATSDGRILP